MSQPDGGAAFPNEDNVAGKMRGGMTLRDYFAGQAVQGVLANLSEMTPEIRSDVARFAKDCYLMADAMIAEREK